MATADPFQQWRQPTGRTGARGDYTDDAPQGHKIIAANYSKHHRKPSQAAKQAVSHPGADPEAYLRAKYAKKKVHWNTDPLEVSWSGATIPIEIIPYEGNERNQQEQQRLRLTERRLQGTWDRNEIHPVRTNRTALIRKTLRSMKPVLKEESDLKRNASIKSLKQSPGLPFYTPREPEMIELTNNSAQLRKKHGGRARAIHNHRSGNKVRVAKNGVRNLDVCRWIDNMETLTSPRAYFQDTNKNKRRPNG